MIYSPRRGRHGQLPSKGGVILGKPRRRDQPLPDTEINEEEMLGALRVAIARHLAHCTSVYVERIYNYVYYRTGNLHDAEDLTARVFQRAMNHIHNYTDRGVPFSAWLYRIAHNLVANWHRDRSRRQEIPLSDLPVWFPRRSGRRPRLVRSQDQDSLMRLIRQLHT